MAALSLRDRLRAATQDDHRRLETGLGLADPGLTLDRYRDVLAGFHGFWAAWEPRVAAELADEAFLAPRRRLHHLRDDLRAFGIEAASLPACPPAPIRGRGEAMGALYVMEGSTLGGRVILKKLKDLLPSPRATSFFAGHGAETGPMWNAFVRRLEQEPDEPAVLRGAGLAFAGMAGWMLREV